MLSKVAVGTKSGDILIYDIASSALVETIKAHTGTVWSLHVRADGNALASGSADKEVKFWDFTQKAINDDSVLIPFSTCLPIIDDLDRHRVVGPCL